MSRLPRNSASLQNLTVKSVSETARAQTARRKSRSVCAEKRLLSSLHSWFSNLAYLAYLELVPACNPGSGAGVLIWLMVVKLEKATQINSLIRRFWSEPDGRHSRDWPEAVAAEHLKTSTKGVLPGEVAWDM
jgi:hypothetical protein